jgi:hydroxymethylpyrimidine/phosphomethylpyrimidine kinase
MHHFCLTIAGSDPSSGAGIQADIRTFDRIGVYPFSVITALTYQTASEFFGFKSLSDELDSQLKALFDIYPIKYVKIGMIPDRKSIEILTKYINEYNLCVVLDPVSISSTGKRLSKVGIEKEMEKKLFPIVTVLTPNVLEAAFYTNTDLKQLNLSSSKNFEKLAQSLLEKLHPSDKPYTWEKAVIIKSAKSEKEKIYDILCLTEGRDKPLIFKSFEKPRTLFKGNIHGTGCVFSSAITAYLAKGCTLFQAIESAEHFFDEKFQKFIELPGEGKVLDLSMSEEHLRVIEQIKEIYSFLSDKQYLSKFIPEVRMNISGALHNATKKQQVAAIEGRITIIDGYPFALGDIKFGVSDHTARLILAAKKFDPSINFVMNLKYNPQWISKLKKKSSLQLVEIKREEQPKKIKNKEFSTMQWLINDVIKKNGKIPDIIWDKGSIGKEPIIRLFGKNSKDIINKLQIISLAININEKI